MALFLCDNFLVYLFANNSPNSLAKVNEANISVVPPLSNNIIQLKLDPPQVKDH